MHTSKHHSGIFTRRLLAALAFFLLPSVAALAATGSIEGRVANTATGNFLNNALVTVQGTRIETATNDQGEYRLTQVPAGLTNITVTYSGMDALTQPVSVVAGQATRLDFSLALQGWKAAKDVIELEKYTVNARELSGQAMAEQERRNAPNIKSVVSMDQFGDMGEGNLGEYLKYVPGISLEYDPQRPVAASIRGMPADGTIVMLNGAEVASSMSATRMFDLGVSANGNADRVEVSKVPTPDMPANAVGGTINIVTKSGFSRSRPLLSYNAFLTSSGLGGLGGVDYHLSTRHGPDPYTDVPPTRPAYNLSYILPVNKKLAFTFSAAQSFRPTEMQFLFAIWDQVAGVQTYNRPSVVIFNEERSLGEISTTWKPGERHTIQASFQSTSSDVATRQFQQVAQLVGTGVSGGRTFSQGTLPATDTAAQAMPWATQFRSLKAGNVGYKFEGSRWTVNANASWSEAGNRRRDVEEGFFGTVTTTLTGLNHRFDGIDYADQGKAAIVTSTDAAGNKVDIYDGNNYSITAANSGGPLDNASTVERIGFDVRRDFDLRVPVSIKIGATVSRTKSVTSGGAYGYAFNPPGGAAGRLARNFDVIDEEFSSSRSFEGANGQPLQIKWISPYKVYELFKAHPEYFTLGVAQEANRYVSQVNTSKEAEETIPATYVRGDVKLLNNRLWLAGGVRFEKTIDKGQGPLNDIGATYQKDANGDYIRVNGRLVPISTDALVTAKLRYTELGARARRSYDGFYPSLNSSFEITGNLVARAAYAKTIGRPNLPLIIPGMTIADPDATAALRTINVVNTALSPWSADNYDLTLELYNTRGATASVSLFRKDLQNFFGTQRSPATLEQLQEIGLTDDYLGFEIVTQQNFGSATIQGFELAYRQSLAPFVPEWARGFEVFGNATTLTLSGPNAADFTNFSPHEGSVGLSYANRRFIAKINVQRSGWIRRTAVAASATVPAGAYNFVTPQTRVDVSAECRLTKHVSLYGSVRNLNGTAKRQSVGGPGIAEYTELAYYQFTGTLVSMGLKGQF